MRTAIEVADIFRAEGPGYRAVQAGHLSLTQLKVMSAIENCRTAALGGHVDACEDCGHWRIAYNSCRNRHCPKCQSAAARTWLAEREADLLPVGYFHVVFTLPTEVADIALQNKAIVYDLLFRAASETMMTIAADPKHLGARIGITAVLHTWGSAMTHHPHIHMIVPGGGISLDAQRWISSRPAFLLPVRVLGALFRRLFLTQLIELYQAGRLAFFGTQAGLADRRLFLRRLAAVRKKRFVVYAKPPFAGPEAVLAYLARYTHRVAISNRRLIAFDETGVTFRYKDYRRDGAERQRVMTLAPHDSSAASCSTSCHAAFTASGITACSPVQHAKQVLRVPASCLASCPRQSLSNCQSRSIISRPVPAAAGACSSSRPSSAGGNPARHLTHLHQPGASPRDPARLALISRRNTAIATNAPIRALRQAQRDRTEYEPWPAPDPRAT